MKFWKGFSFFFIYPFTMLLAGFLGGVIFMDFFFPYGSGNADIGYGKQQETGTQYPDWLSDAEEMKDGDLSGKASDSAEEDNAFGNMDPNDKDPDPAGDSDGTVSGGEEAPFTDVLAQGARLNANTAYVLEETDIRNSSVVETTWKLPSMYIGMNREQFLKAMDTYEAFPPLSEQERGFVGLEVLSFSADKVVVRMDYAYIQPSDSFYIVVQDGLLVVYLDDRRTVYMDTNIQLTELPEAVQQEVIDWLYIPDEESLYDFLENYSS